MPSLPLGMLSTKGTAMSFVTGFLSNIKCPICGVSNEEDITHPSTPDISEMAELEDEPKTTAGMSVMLLFTMQAS